MLAIEFISAIVLLVSMGVLATFENCVDRISALTLRVLADRYRGKLGYSLLEEMAADRSGFLVPIQFAIQTFAVGLVIAVAALFLNSDFGNAFLWSLLSGVVLVSLFRQIIPYAIARRNPERVLVALLPSFTPAYRFLEWLSFPVLLVFRRPEGDEEEQGSENGQDDEATEEEIQAYLDVGEEEGIFERTDTELIQSALEFGSTLVREIMTPRSEMVVIDESATLAQLKDLIVATKHSRVPVYREKLDQIVGVAYVRNLLPLLEPGKDSRPITSIVNDVPIVPETKRVSELLKELQARADQMAMVVNEYGTISGLVTVEDLLEEIVGEIRDEDESRRVDLVYEGKGNYIVRGGAELVELEETLGVGLTEVDAATVSGMVVDHLGRVPIPGESLVLSNVWFEVLSSDHRRINKLRVHRLPDSKEG
jgi:CBS domain containing-hemolysin-like protein